MNNTIVVVLVVVERNETKQFFPILTQQKQKKGFLKSAIEKWIRPGIVKIDDSCIYAVCISCNNTTSINGERMKINKIYMEFKFCFL
jgi:hypothetical protein